MTIQEAALQYRELGFSIFPLRIDKKPVLEWRPYQERFATDDEFNKWYCNGSPHRIGIVTGKLSNIVVVDIDDLEKGPENLKKYIDLDIETPIAKTPTGGFHLYFRYPNVEVRNNAGGIPGCDFRGEGGFVVAPPSYCEYVKKGKEIKGTYTWVKDIASTPLAELPISYIKALDSFNMYMGSRQPQSQVTTSDDTRRQVTTVFIEGTRDNDLFHVANCLIKGGCEQDFAKQVIEILANNCQPPFPEREINAKIESALQRAHNREQNLSEEILDFVLTTTGDFLTTEIYNRRQVTTRNEKQNICLILRRLAEKKIIEPTGTKNGTWRLINTKYEPQKWWQSQGSPCQLQMPLGLESIARMYHGSGVLIEGVKSSGKSTWGLEIARTNRHLFPGHKVLYENIEMPDDELNERFDNYPPEVMTREEWKRDVEIMNPRKNKCSYWDIIDPDGLNIIDYIVNYEKAYLIPETIQKIVDKLRSGIAVMMLQRNPLVPFGQGGYHTRNIPRLCLSLFKGGPDSPNKVKIEDVKSYYKPQGKDTHNPTGMSRRYKLVNWWKILPVSEWVYEEDEKYGKIANKKEDDFIHEE